MTRVVFLLEEPSMKVLLDGLLPRFFPDLMAGLDALAAALGARPLPEST